MNEKDWRGIDVRLVGVLNIPPPVELHISDVIREKAQAATSMAWTF